MPSRLNQLTIQEILKTFDGVDTCMFVDFTGLDGRRTADLRRQLRQTCGKGTAFTVVKTSLAKHAFKQMNQFEMPEEALAKYLSGPTGIVFGADDPVVLAKALTEWGKKEKKPLNIKGGILDGKPLAAEAVVQLSKIPPRQVLLAKVAGAVAAPLTTFLAATQAPIRKLNGVLEALAKQKGAAA